MAATPDQQKAYRRRLRLRVAVLYGIVCEHCGGSRELQLAHKERTKLKGEGRGLTHRLLDAIRNRDKYLLLCRKCHRKFGGPEDRDDDGAAVPF